VPCTLGWPWTWSSGPRLHGGSPRTDARATAVSTIPISNAHVERLLRVVSTFRKNSLFVGSLEAGERYANLLTVLLNCELAGVNPYVYLVDVIDKIADDWPADRAAELLPRAWLAARQAEQQAPGEAAPSWSRSSSRIAQPLSHPPRHRSQMVTVGRIRRQARRPPCRQSPGRRSPGPPVAGPPVARSAGLQVHRSSGPPVAGAFAMAGWRNAAVRPSCRSTGSPVTKEVPDGQAKDRVRQAAGRCRQGRRSPGARRRHGIGDQELALGGQHEPAQLLREIARDDIEPGAAFLRRRHLCARVGPSDPQARRPEVKNSLLERPQFAEPEPTTIWGASARYLRSSARIAHPVGGVRGGEPVAARSPRALRPISHSK